MPQVPGDLNLKDFNVPRRALETVPKVVPKKLVKAAVGKNSSVFVGEAAKIDGDGGMTLELEDPVAAAGDSLKANERLEAFINQMMKKAETLNTTREEQIVKKQQILEELQKVEQQLLLSSHRRGEADGEPADDDDLLADLDLDPEELLSQMQAAVAAYTARGGDQALACAPMPVPLHVALHKDMEAQVQAAIAAAAAATKESSEITKMANESIHESTKGLSHEAVNKSIPQIEAAATKEEDEDEDKKLPQLAKQESLSSVASSADSGCGNSDINHGGGGDGKAEQCAVHDVVPATEDEAKELEPDDIKHRLSQQQLQILQHQLLQHKLANSKFTCLCLPYNQGYPFLLGLGLFTRLSVTVINCLEKKDYI